MSGIAKPHLFFSTATGTGQTDIMVPVEHILTVEKADLPANGNNPAQVRLCVVLVPQVGGNVMYFNFASNATRNTALAAVKTLIAASV